MDVRVKSCAWGIVAAFFVMTYLVQEARGQTQPIVEASLYASLTQPDIAFAITGAEVLDESDSSDSLEQASVDTDFAALETNLEAVAFCAACGQSKALAKAVAGSHKIVFWNNDFSYSLRFVLRRSAVGRPVQANGDWQQWRARYRRLVSNSSS
jgi:hypothetical protein